MSRCRREVINRNVANLGYTLNLRTLTRFDPQTGQIDGALTLFEIGFFKNNFLGRAKHHHLDHFRTVEPVLTQITALEYHAPRTIHALHLHLRRFDRTLRAIRVPPTDIGFSNIEGADIDIFMIGE